jgi:RNA polymerase sigma factor (TIGR02999 family)
MSDVTRILNAIERGDTKAADELLPLVYEELRLLAAQKLSHEPPGQTLQATALVHEAYIRLVGNAPQSWSGRGHFFAAAAEAMRRILVEAARRKKRKKHGGGLKRLDLSALDVAVATDDETILLVHEALERLSEIDEVGARLIELRFFAGIPNIQAAKILGIPERTAKRTWAYARAWLYEEMRRMR